MNISDVGEDVVKGVLVTIQKLSGASRASNLLRTARQQLTHDWWDL